MKFDVEPLAQVLFAVLKNGQLVLLFVGFGAVLNVVLVVVAMDRLEAVHVVVQLEAPYPIFEEFDFVSIKF